MTINPYAPTSEVLSSDPQRTALPAGMSSQGLIWRSVGHVTLSGAVFGFGVTLVVIVGRIGSLGPGVLLLPVLGALVGGTIAFLGALIIVPLTYVFVVRLRSGQISGRVVRQFGFASGFLTGDLTLFAMSGLSVYGALMGLVPGVVGGVVTMLLMLPTAKRVDRATSISDESVQGTESTRQSIVDPMTVSE